MVPRLDSETKRRILELESPNGAGDTGCQEAQWLNMDARDMDTAVLGRYVIRSMRLVERCLTAVVALQL